jgi:hypothetical protein
MRRSAERDIVPYDHGLGCAASMVRRQGRYDVEDRYIHGFRLLLTPAVVGRDPHVEARWRGHVRRKAATPSSAMLLAEFIARFDRSLLPTAEVLVL